MAREFKYRILSAISKGGSTVVTARLLNLAYFLTLHSSYAGAERQILTPETNFSSLIHEIAA